MVLIADTGFYIDLQRKPEICSPWLQTHPDAVLVLTAITYGELLVGQPDRSVLDRLVGEGPRLDLDFEAAARFGRLGRHLRSMGQMIGANDLWIAAIALANHLPVLTRNVDEFRRIPDLTVETY